MTSGESDSRGKMGKTCNNFVVQSYLTEQPIGPDTNETTSMKY